MNAIARCVMQNIIPNNYNYKKVRCHYRGSPPSVVVTRINQVIQDLNQLPLDYTIELRWEENEEMGLVEGIGEMCRREKRAAYRDGGEKK